eukprot:886825-Pyramimonas_sp.AAC.1
MRKRNPELRYFSCSSRALPSSPLPLLLSIMLLGGTVIRPCVPRLSFPWRWALERGKGEDRR